MENVSPIVNPTGIYMFNANNRNTRTGCEICSKLQISPSLSFAGVLTKPPQSAFRYSKLTIETLEKGAKYVQSQ